VAPFPEPGPKRLAKHCLPAVEEAETQMAQPPRQRIAGLGTGTILIAEEFDEPRPAALGLGDAGDGASLPMLCGGGRTSRRV